MNDRIIRDKRWLPCLYAEKPWLELGREYEVVRFMWVAANQPECEIRDAKTGEPLGTLNWGEYRQAFIKPTFGPEKAGP